MPINSIQFRKTIGKYEKSSSPVNKPIKSIRFTDSTQLAQIKKIVANSLPNRHIPIFVEDKPFANIKSENQSGVKISLLLLLFLSQIGVTHSLSLSNFGVKAPLPEKEDKNWNKNDSNGTLQYDLSNNFFDPLNKLWENIENALPNKLIAFDLLRFPGAQAAALPEFAHIEEKIHPIRHDKRTYLNHRILKKINKKLFNILGKEKITKEGLISLVFQYSHLDPENLQKIAKTILSKLQPYSIQQPASLSVRHSQTIISDWISNTVLDQPLAEYIAKAVAKDPHHSEYEISDLMELLSLKKLEREKIINLDGFSEEMKSDFEILWNSFLKTELPFIHFCKEDKSLQDILLEDLRFANLYTGSRYLSQFNNFENLERYKSRSNSSDYNVLNHFNASEVSAIGKAMWEIAGSEGISIATQPYFLMPSLFFEAQNAPDKIIKTRNINDITEIAIIDQLTYRKIAQQINTSMMLHLNNFKQLLIKWSEMDAELKDVNNEEYKKLIGEIRDYFSDLDEYLLVAALNSLSKDEKEFIFSPDTLVSPVTMSKTRKNRGRILPIRGTKCLNQKSKYVPCGISISQPVALNRTDLFSVYTEKENRIYALKNNGNRYEMFRVDKNLYTYRELELLDPKEIKDGYIISSNEIKISNKVFVFEFDLDKSFTREKGSIERLIDFFKTEHSNELYTSLSEADDSRSTWGKIWDIVKHFIPFYDCADGILQGDLIQAAPSCLLDAVIISPLFKGSVKTVEKFGLYLAKGMRTTRLSLDKNSISFVNSHSALVKEINFSEVTELRTVQKNIFSSVDSRFESFQEVSKKYTDRLIDYLNKDKSTASLSEKIQSIAREKPLSDFPDDYITARLPNSEIRVPIRKVGEQQGREIYTVFNPQTRETTWGRFILQENNQLLLVEASPVKVSNSLKKIITEDMYARDLDVHSLSEPDYMGLRWDSQHAHCYLNHKNKWLKIKILNKQLFLDSEKGIVPLKIKNYTLIPEGFLDRIVRFQKQGFAGTNLSAKQVIAKKLNLSEEQAAQLIEKYQFPENSNHYTQETFALWIEKTGQIPSWAEAFEILNRDQYISRFVTGEMQNNGLYSFSGGKGFVYRVDRTRPDIILRQGFVPTEDYGALEKMIPDDESGLTVAGDLTGALRYDKWVNSPYIYRINIENIRGVSLKDNLMKNSRNLKSFLGEDPNQMYTTIESLGQDCNGAIYLDEIHLYSADVLPEYITLVTKEEIEREMPLAEGVWENYL